VIVAEGSFSETFIDDVSRGIFHNAHEYREFYSGETSVPARFCAPRLRDGYRVEAARRHIDTLAGLRHDTSATLPLRGFVDVVKAKTISGWAQSPDYPEAPVCLEIVADSRVMGEVVANLYRENLQVAGLGSGRHGFEFKLPAAMSAALSVVEVRRALDGVALPVSGRSEHGRNRASRCMMRAIWKPRASFSCQFQPTPLPETDEKRLRTIVTPEATRQSSRRIWADRSRHAPALDHSGQAEAQEFLPLWPHVGSST
jgi:hypothetical protein